MLKILLTLGLCVGYCECSLELVHVFFRHGKRTAEKYEVCTDDPYAEHWKEVGYGRLTPIGVHESYKLGTILRNRYNAFLPKVFEPELIKTQSTNRNRTRMTALAVLSGLFPSSFPEPLTEPINRTDIYEYPDHAKDYELRHPKLYCPVYVKELQKIIESKEHVSRLSKYRDTFKVLRNRCGMPTNSLVDALYAFQSASSAIYANLSLPNWASDVYDSLREMAILRLSTENYNTKLKRLSGGRMFRPVLENMIKKSQNLLLPSERKMFLYSAHDINVANTLAVLDIFKPHFPHYNSAVMIELHREPDERYIVKVYYLRDTDNDPEELLLEHCGTICELQQLKNIMQPLLPINYTRECESDILLH